MWGATHEPLGRKICHCGYENLFERSTLGSETISDNWKPFKNNEKCFLFHVFISCFSLFRYLHFCPDFLVVVLVKKNGLIDHLRLTSKFMTSQTGQRIITIQILPIFSFWLSSTLTYNKIKLYNISDYWSWDMLNFEFFLKGLGKVSPKQFVHDFSRKIFLMLTIN